MKSRIAVLIGFSAVYLLVLMGIFAWMSSPGFTEYMLAPFVLSFGLIGLIGIWVVALVGIPIAKALQGNDDEEQQPFSRRDYAENAVGSAAWEARQRAIRQRRQQTQSNSPPDSTEE